MQIDQKLEQYIESRIDVAGLSDAEKKEIIEGVAKNISVGVSIVVFDSLNKKDREEFVRLSKLADGQQIRDFVDSKVPGVQALVEKEIDKIIDEFNELRTA